MEDIVLEEVELIEGERLEIVIGPLSRSTGCSRWPETADGARESERSTWDCEGMVFK